MEYFRKLKKYVLGEDLTPADQPGASSCRAGPEGASHPPSGPERPLASGAATRPALPPVLQNAGESGGVQGLGWYASGMKQDRDGDFALEFLEELHAAPTAPNEPQNPTMQVQLQDVRAAPVAQVSVDRGEVHVNVPK